MSRSYTKRSTQPTNTIPVVLILASIVVALIASKLSAAVIASVIIGTIALAVLILTILAVILYHVRQLRRQKLRALDLVDIDAMDGLVFEKYVAELLKHQGYHHVTLTERYDYGIDIIAQKDGVTWGIQVKRYSNLVKAAAVRQVVTALKTYHCQRAMVVTNSTFSRPARILADSNNCLLIDKDKLAGWMVAFQTGK